MAHVWLDANGWRQVPVKGERYRSAVQAFTYRQDAPGCV